MRSVRARGDYGRGLPVERPRDRLGLRGERLCRAKRDLGHFPPPAGPPKESRLEEIADELFRRGHEVDRSLSTWREPIQVNLHRGPRGSHGRQLRLVLITCPRGTGDAPKLDGPAREKSRKIDVMHSEAEEDAVLVRSRERGGHSPYRDGSHISGVNEIPQGADDRIEPLRVADEQARRSTRCFPEESICFARTRAERFLDENVAPPIERESRGVGVGIGGGRDDDEVNGGNARGLVVETGHVPQACNFVRDRRARIEHPRKLEVVRQTANDAGMPLAHRPYAENRNPTRAGGRCAQSSNRGADRGSSHT